MKTIFTFLIIFSIKIQAQNRVQFPPIKDSIVEVSLVKFIDTLKAIVNRKDKKIYSLLDKNISNGFEVRIDGISNFKKIWNPLTNNQLWNTLKKIMSFGGQYITDVEINKPDKSIYIFPYFFDSQIKEMDEFYELYVVDGSDIPIKETCNIDAKTIIICNYEVVRMTDSTSHLNKNGWFFVQSLDNVNKGFIIGTRLYNFADYRMIIRKQKGVWKITGLVSGG
jgi:hypothetical protein